MKIDLHFHSYFSDGSQSPKDLIKEYQEMGYSALSLTDHNTISGYKEIEKLENENKIRIIPGIELSTQYKGIHIHLMAYNFKEDKIIDFLKQIQKQREIEILEKIKKLSKIGFKINYKDLRKAFPKVEYWDDKHLIIFLQINNFNKEKLKTFSHNFDLWDLINSLFSDESLAYVKPLYVDSLEAIKIAKSANSFISIAHPAQQLQYTQDEIIEKLADTGLDAIEVISQHHNWDNNIHYQNLAQKLNLKMTAGTDYHENVDFEIPVHDSRTIWDLPNSFPLSI